MAERARAFAALAVLAVALASGLKELPGTWRWLSEQRSQFAHFTAQEREQEPGTAQLLPVDAFDFFRTKLSEGERYYLAVTPGGFTSGVDRAQAARIFGRFYLLPAVLTSSPADATVVLSYRANPAALHLSYVTQRRDGSSPIYVSRIGAP